MRRHTSQGGCAALVLGAAVLLSASCSGGGGSPAQPTASAPAQKTVPVAALMDRVLANRVAGSYNGYPPYMDYAACGSIQNVGSQNMTYWTELFVSGPDGAQYEAEQNYDNLVPRRWASGSGRLGCGFSSARDFKLSRTIASRARLVIHYTLDDGETGTVEASTSNIRDTAIPPQ